MRGDQLLGTGQVEKTSMTEKKLMLEYAKPRKVPPGYFATYWHLYAPFVIMLLVVALWVGLTLIGF